MTKKPQTNKIIIMIQTDTFTELKVFDKSCFGMLVMFDMLGNEIFGKLKNGSI